MFAQSDSIFRTKGQHCLQKVTKFFAQRDTVFCKQNYVCHVKTSEVSPCRTETEARFANTISLSKSIRAGTEISGLLARRCLVNIFGSSSKKGLQT